MARKQSIIIRCDGNGCKEIGEVADLAETPCGWYRVYPVGESLKVSQSSVFDFHSLRCIEKWANARRVEVENKPRIMPGVNYPPINGNAPKASQPTEKGNAIREAVAAILEEQDTFLSRDVQDLSGVSQNTADTHLRRMVNAGELAFTTEPIKRSTGASFPTRIYHAPETTSP